VEKEDGYMGKKKIADSIIIRVGGGIREVRRKPLEVEGADTSHGEADFDQAEDMKHFKSELGAIAGIDPTKIIN
jgi:hypothetical protein